MNASLIPFIVPGTILFLLIIGLKGALFPLMAAFILSYLLFPVLRKMESRGINRHHAIIGLSTILLGLFFISAFTIVPSIISDALTLGRELPTAIHRSTSQIESFLYDVGLPWNISRNEIVASTSESLSTLATSAANALGTVLRSTLGGVSSVLVSIINLFLFPVFFFYILDGYEGISKHVTSVVPRGSKKYFSHLGTQIDRILNGYIRGQLMVALILSCYYSIGLTIIGLRFGWIIGILAGLLSVVPYAGFAIGFATSIFLALAQGNPSLMLFGVFLLFGTAQVIESFFITPRIVGDKVGLGPLSSMIALIVGGNLLGFVGMVVAIPMAAILKVLLQDSREAYFKSDLYKEA